MVRSNTKTDGSLERQAFFKLFNRSIKTYSNEGDTILDNCAGSGTTWLAAKNLNRNCILMEKEKYYYEEMTLTEECVAQIERKIKDREYHEVWFNKDPNRLAIRITPFEYYKEVYTEVEKELNKRGYDCYIKSCYDARGPHDCLFFKHII